VSSGVVSERGSERRVRREGVVRAAGAAEASGGSGGSGGSERRERAAGA
jgi:hypothetical protein